MTSLAARVASTFGSDGALARRLPALQRRAGQAEMAQAVSETIADGGILVAEAGTGVGKTLAYLVPLLLGGVRAVVSTSSHVLQAQLAQRDIPALSEALGIPVRTALLKGRAHYLCNHRLEQTVRMVEGVTGVDPRDRADLATIRYWALQTPSGDFAELPGGAVGSRWRVHLGSTADSCLYAECSHFTACHFRRARLQAESADWLIVNHHLYLAEMLIRRTGQEPWLVGRDTVVFDEAHRLPELSRAMLGHSVGQQHLKHLATEFAQIAPIEAPGMQPWAYLAMCLGQSVDELGAALTHMLPLQPRIRWVDGSPQGVQPFQWNRLASAVADALQAIHDALSAAAQTSPNLRSLLQTVIKVMQDWRVLLRGPEANPNPVAQWLAWEGMHTGEPRWSLVQAPVAVEHGLSRWMRDPQNAGVSWVFTSATLGHDAALDWFTRPMGLQGLKPLKTVRFDALTQRSDQMAVYIPLDLPDPSDPLHSLALADGVAEWAAALDGRTLVLTTTVKAARRIAHRLRWRLDQTGKNTLQVLDETLASRERLLAAFRQAGSLGDQADSRQDFSQRRGAVLVVSMAFWEGVDFPGEILQLLVIDKLPFPSPEDPMVQARALVGQSRGLDAFEHTFLPDTELALRQGAGRLIRSYSDEGVLVVGDRRLALRSYGQQLLRSLPPHRRVMDAAQLAAELQRLRLTRASTRDRSLF